MYYDVVYSLFQYFLKIPRSPVLGFLFLYNELKPLNPALCANCSKSVQLQAENKRKIQMLE